MTTEYRPQSNYEMGSIYSGRCYAFLSDKDPKREIKLSYLKRNNFNFFKRATFEEFMYMTNMCNSCDDCDE